MKKRVMANYFIKSSFFIFFNGTLASMSLLINFILYFRYKCHVCENWDCKNETSIGDHICYNALTCWKSRVRDTNGVERVSRGCTTSSEHLPLCFNLKDSNSAIKKRDAGSSGGLGTYNIECCTGDYCNNGSFPILPPLKTEIPIDSTNDDILKISLAIFVPIIVIGLLAIAIILYMRRNHKRRLMDARNQHDPDIYYANDDLIKRSHACGDSTLRVGFIFSNFPINSF